MPITELSFPGQEKGFIAPNTLMSSREFVVSPSLPGNLYEITRLVDDNGNIFALKTLKDSVVAAGKYPPTYSLEDVFTLHQREHNIFLQYMEQFVLPTAFYKEETDDHRYYRAVQPWVQFGVQFKEAIRNQRTVPDYQLPDLEERIIFIHSFSRLLKSHEVYPRIADLDFFLAPVNNHTTILLIDTNFLWHPKHHSDSRLIHHHITNFLFTSEERKIREIQEALSTLGDALHMNQLD